MLITISQRLPPECHTWHWIQVHEDSTRGLQQKTLLAYDLHPVTVSTDFWGSPQLTCDEGTIHSAIQKGSRSLPRQGFLISPHNLRL